MRYTTNIENKYRIIAIILYFYSRKEYLALVLLSTVWKYK